MTKLIESLILQTASDENLDLEQFIDELRKNPDDWYAFRRDELAKFIESVLFNVSLLTDSSAIAPTGPTYEDLLLHFGIKELPPEPEETPIDWHAE